MANNTCKRRRQDKDGDDIAKKRQRTSLVLAKIEQASSRSLAPRASLGGMPYDIIEAIFEESYIDASVCLSLTCTRLFAFFQIHHGEDKILLQANVNFPESTPSEVRNKRLYLGDLLANWGIAGSLYRYSPLTFRFLNVTVYGAFEGTEERRLLWRYRDYHLSMANTREPYRDPRLIFPSPRNRGEEWYGEALAAIKASLDLFGHIIVWVDYWCQTCLFTENWHALKIFAHEWNQKRSRLR